MSSNAFPPNQKRFRPDNGSINDSDSPENLGQISKPHKCSSDNIFNCVVENRGRHLFSSAVATNASDAELSMSNGDSGFQELSMTDELAILTEGKISMLNKPTPIEINVVQTDQKATDESKSEIGNQSSSKDCLDDDDDHDDNINDEDDNDSLSDISYASDFSSLSGEEWKPINNNIEWVNRQIESGVDPNEIIQQMNGGEIFNQIGQLNSVLALRLLIRMLSQPSARTKLNNVNTIDDVIDLIRNSSKIIVLTGAGVSVSCGIPDFRSRNGIYARLSKDYPDIPDPPSMFDITYFRRNPHPFFRFAKEIYPGQFEPSASHKFIKYMEIKGKLLRNYSQNIDTLEKAAGIENVITCHGSFATATCTVCGFKVDSNAIKNEIFAQKIPLCSRCTSAEKTDMDPNMLPTNRDDDVLPIMKPDIVFFGEGLSDEFHNSMTIDKNQCDLLIVIGSSLKVRPVALIPNSVSEEIPQILINREPLDHFNFDVELLGDCDVIIKHLCKRLGNDWVDYCFTRNAEAIDQQADTNKEYEFVPPSRYIFEGAEVIDPYDSDADDYDSESIDEKNEVDKQSNDDDDVNVHREELIQNDLCKQLDTRSTETKALVLFENQDSMKEIDQLRFNNHNADESF